MMTTSNDNKLGIYIHIPFCIRKCPYCGFYSAPLASSDDLRAYKERLIGEIDEFCEALAERCTVDSIFFGGGTPSIMLPAYIDEIITHIRKHFNVTSDCETTLEANPATRSSEMYAASVNRLSIGVQSFDDAVLKTLGRVHSAAEAEEAFRQARAAGFDNINLDLMFGIPGQTIKQWEATLDKAIALNPEHISFYSLQIEEGTPYMERFEKGEFDELPDEVDREMYHLAIKKLKDAGYKHYEISNAAKPGFECRHNLKYWTGEEYVGFGDSASSYLMRSRTNECATSVDLAQNQAQCDLGYYGGVRYNMMLGDKKYFHVNTKFDDMSEYAFTGIRLVSGIDYGAFHSRFGISFREAFADRWAELKEFFDSGALVEWVDQEGTPMRLALTERGIDISNKIMAVFV